MSTRDYKKGMKDGLDPFAEECRRTGESVRDLGEQLGKRIDDVIDVIAMMVQGEDAERIIEELKAKKAFQLARYKIAVVHDKKEDEELADNIRKNLNAIKNDCVSVSYKQYKQTGVGMRDFVVFIGNLEKTDVGEATLLYRAFGCEIFQFGYHIIIRHNPNIWLSDEERAQFIAYYEEVLSKSFGEEGNAKKAKKAVNRIKEKKVDVEKNVVLDFMEAVPEWWDAIEYSRLPRPIAKAIKTLSIPLMLGSVIAAVPVAFGEGIARITVEHLQINNFHSKFIGIAQQQLIQVKLNEFVRNQQLMNMN